jgi:3-hydroxybutyryl-CoA dehydratase
MVDRGYDIDALSLGMTASSSHIISEDDIHLFANISGDTNLVHLSEDYAKKTIFKKRIAHGLISASFFSALFGTKLPGEGCVYVQQNLHFKKPVYIGDKVFALIEIIGIDIKKRRVFFKTSCKVENKVVIIGTAEIYIPPKNLITK